MFLPSLKNRLPLPLLLVALAAAGCANDPALPPEAEASINAAERGIDDINQRVDGLVDQFCEARNGVSDALDALEELPNVETGEARRQLEASTRDVAQALGVEELFDKRVQERCPPAPNPSS